MSVRKASYDFILRRKLIWRRIGQHCVFLLCLALSAGLCSLPLNLDATLPAAAFIMVLCLALMFASDCRYMNIHYHFQLFPPGSGTMRRLTELGSSRFLSLFEYKMRHFWKGQGIFLGRPVPEQRPLGFFSKWWVGSTDDRHMLTVAPSRYGKGTGALVPNLLLYTGSAFVVDPKGELARITASRRGRGSTRVKQSLGQRVVVLDLLVSPDPTDFGPNGRLLPENSQPARWNPLAEFNPDDVDVVAKVQGIAFSMIPPEASATDTFFINQARQLLTMLILHVLTTEPEERRNLIHVRRLLSQGDVALFDAVAAACKEDGKQMPHANAHEALFAYMKCNPSYDGKISGFASQYIALAEQTRSGVISDLYGRTNYLDLAKLEYMLQGSDFRLADLKREPMTVYLCAQGTRLGAELKPIVTIMIDHAIKAMEATPARQKQPVLFLMDEFSLLGKQDSIDLAMGLIAGFGVKLWPVVQSIDQLKKDYPASWDNFRLNCGAIQYIGDQTDVILDELERHIGYTATGSAQGGEQRRALLSAQQLRTGYMNRDSRRQIVLFTQQPAAPLELCHYYLHPWLNKLSEPEHQADSKAG